MYLAVCSKGWAGGGHWQLFSPAQQYWYHRNLSLLDGAVWLSTTVVVVLRLSWDRERVGQGVYETGSAAVRKAVNEPMEEAFISRVYRERRR